MHIWCCQQNGADIVKKVNGVFCFKVNAKDKEGTWIVNLKSGSGSVKFDSEGMLCTVVIIIVIV